MFVNTASQLKEVVVPNLLQHQVIGVDLEYWLDSTNAKIAFICTMQLSTLTGNFVIDVLKLSKHTSMALKHIFASKDFIKVGGGGGGLIKHVTWCCEGPARWGDRLEAAEEGLRLGHRELIRHCEGLLEIE